MRILKLPLSFLAVIIAVMAAFAFSPKPVSVSAKGPKSLVWVKYDCAHDGVVEIITGGNTSTTLFAECGGDGNICAQQFDTSQLEPIPNEPDNFRPKDGQNPMHTVFCP